MNINGINGMAKLVLQKQGSHAPQAIFINEDKVDIVLLHFNGDYEKERIMDKLRRYVAENKPDCYYIINEGWMKVMKQGEKYVRPSLAEDRTEVLIVSEFRRDGFTNTIVTKFKHEGSGILFGEEMLKPDGFCSFCSMWNFYLEKEGLQERMDGDIKKMEDG